MCPTTIPQANYRAATVVSDGYLYLSVVNVDADAEGTPLNADLRAAVQYALLATS